MLLYDADKDRDEAAASYLSQALQQGHFAVYASVKAKDAIYIEQFSSNIMNYEENMAQGNLLFVRLHSFYDRALSGYLEPFEDLKAILEAALEERFVAGKIA